VNTRVRKGNCSLYKNTLYADAGTDIACKLHSSTYCCNGHSEINRKMEISTLCTITTPQNFMLKFGTRDYVRHMTPIQILCQIGSAGVSSYKYVKYDTFVAFCTVHTFFDPLHKSNHGTGATRSMAQTTCLSKEVPFGG